MAKKKRLPQELEDLLWTVAESDDPRVRSEFELRYPHLRGELATRTAMLDVLRHAKPKSGSEGSKLRPFETPKSARPRSLWLAPALAVLLAALGFGAFSLTKLLISSSAPPPKTEVQGTRSEPSQAPPEDGGTMQGMTPDGVEDAGRRGVGERPTPPPTPEKSIELLAQGMSLMEALDKIAMFGQVDIQVMPDVQNVPLVFGDSPPGAKVIGNVRQLLEMIERVAPVRILDNGENAYLVLPLDKVRNLEPEPGPTGEAAPSSSRPRGPVSSSGGN